jgi:hypothetical protein
MFSEFAIESASDVIIARGFEQSETSVPHGWFSEGF